MFFARRRRRSGAWVLRGLGIVAAGAALVAFADPRRREALRRAARLGAAPPRAAAPRRAVEVREVKSPGELGPGIASASPDPLRPGRVDRPDLRARPPAPRRRPDDEELEPPEWVAPHDGFTAPRVGAGVREADLGSMLPTDELIEEEEDRAGEATSPGAPGREHAGDDEGKARRDPTNDGG